MPIFSIQYTYAPEQAELRDEMRPAHREWLGAGEKAGDVLVAGPYTAGDGALLLIRAVDEAAAAEYLSGDPFVEAGAIAATRIDEWRAVFGPFEN
ncbi:MAG: YciI family protein [Gordonia sp. (in: high G+C Gram-positive bacteria)]